MNHLLLLFSIYLCILFASFLASLLNRKNLEDYAPLFSTLTGVTFLVESIAFYMLFFAYEKTHFLYHYFLPFSYTLIALIYRKAVTKAWIKKALSVSVPLFLGAHLFLSVFVQKIDSVNSYAIMGASFLIILSSLSYFYDLLTRTEIVKLSATPLFWISTGNIFFYSGAFFLMGFLNYLMREELGLASKLIVINYSLNYLLYSFYTIGFLCAGRLRKSWL